jgi:hypothetical protein
MIGVVNFIRVPQMPVMLFKLCLFNRWTAGVGEFIESVRVIAPDETSVICKSERKFALQDVTHNINTVAVWTPMKFEVAGTYYIEVLVDDVMKLRFPVLIIHTPQEQPGQRPAA